ncbi:MAG TPA: TolC family protein [Acidobacteriaceae bacterium]|nr:TolC family protein [Acidobacteriaceae bacterium]
MFFLQKKREAIVGLAILLAAAASLPGQMPSASQGASARAAQLPLSGRGSAGPTVRQSAAPSPSSSVNTLSPQIQIQGAYGGSVPGKDNPQGTITLTMEEAVRRGLAANLGVIGADAASQQAKAQRLQARSSLLPNINASISENAAKVDLAAEGFSASAFGSSLPFSFPMVVGPFHYYDVHGSLQQNLLDLTAIHNLKSAQHSSNAAALDARQAREEVVLTVAGLYLQLMASTAELEQQQAEVQYAEASYKQALAQADAGTKAPIEANRSLVELQTEQQRLRSQQGDIQKQKNQLARAIGLPLGIEIHLAEKLEALHAPMPELEDAIHRAWARRQDLQSAEAQLRAAEEARKAAGAERLPSASVSGQYGLQGTNPDQGAGVFQATASLAIPIFQGGRIHADTVQADAVVTQRRAELADQRGVVEMDVRNASIDLNVANDQVTTAESNRKLALQNLQQSQDRFAVGVADSVEVVNSQESLAAADHDYVSSLFSQYLARLTLAHATGEAEKTLSDLFKRNEQ